MDHDAVTEEVEQDFASLLAVESEEVSEEVDDVYSGELPEDPAELKQMLIDAQSRVGKRNKTLKMRTDANHRIQDELKAVQDQLEVLKNSNNQAPNVEAQSAERKEARTNWQDSVAEKPEVGIDYTDMQVSELKDNFATYITEMKASQEARIEELEARLDPERMKNREKIDQLRSNPALANMDDDTLMAFLKAGSGIKQTRGSIGGRRAEQKPTAEKQLEADRKRAKEYFANDGFGG